MLSATISLFILNISIILCFDLINLVSSNSIFLHVYLAFSALPKFIPNFLKALNLFISNNMRWFKFEYLNIVIFADDIILCYVLLTRFQVKRTSLLLSYLIKELYDEQSSADETIAEIINDR
ncbi:hypothetical protein H8356DRAFT_1341221 [Neocallimastix lanati (nom. inval.)]|nr:hypothetical protein H8356DRAFT_1341221 [Neocallimastix sp. JGI-2020a]